MELGWLDVEQSRSYVCICVCLCVCSVWVVGMMYRVLVGRDQGGLQGVRGYKICLVVGVSTRLRRKGSASSTQGFVGR